ALFFFFQAEDGIRDPLVTEFRRVLFRSRDPRGSAGFAGAASLDRKSRRAPPSLSGAQDRGPRLLGLERARSPRLAHGPVTRSRRSEERRVGKEGGCRERRYEST